MPQNVKIKKNVSKKLIKSKFIKEKIISLSNIIQKCMIFIQKLKTLDIITASQLNLGLNQLETINNLLKNTEFSFTLLLLIICKILITSYHRISKIMVPTQ